MISVFPTPFPYRSLWKALYSVIEKMPIRVPEALVAIDFSDMNKITQAQLNATYSEKLTIKKI